MINALEMLKVGDHARKLPHLLLEKRHQVHMKILLLKVSLTTKHLNCQSDIDARQVLVINLENKAPLSNKSSNCFTL